MTLMEGVFNNRFLILHLFFITFSLKIAVYNSFSSYFCQSIFCAIKNKDNFKQNKNYIFSSQSSYQVIFKLDFPVIQKSQAT